MNITVDYMFTSDDMTDEQYENQEEMEFKITEQEIHELLFENAGAPSDIEIMSFDEVDNTIKVEYIVDEDDMTDEEYENQEEKTFIITEDMIIEFMEDNISIPKGHEICRDNFYVNKSW